MHKRKRQGKALRKEIKKRGRILDRDNSISKEEMSSKEEELISRVK